MGKKGIAVVCLLTLLLSVAASGFAGYLAAEHIFEQKLSDRTGDKKTSQSDSLSDDAGSVDTNAMTVTEVAQRCTKSVVNITVKEKTKGYTGGSAYTETVTGHGTGVIMREDGYIVTCHHVIDGADSIYVIFDDQTEAEAKLVGFDSRFDLAVIHVDKNGLPAAEMGDSDGINAGEGVVIIGNPLGEFGSSVSAGVLSAPTRELTIEGTPLRLMQTDAAVNPGNSGGGMFNMQGQWIAMVNAKISASGIEGIGFAIPLNTIRQNIDSIIANGEASKTAVLGVGTKQTTCYVDGKNVDCLEITSVKEGGAAAEAGLQVGDCLLSANGKELKDNNSLTLVIKYLSAGDQVELDVYRNKAKIKITATLK